MQNLFDIMAYTLVVIGAATLFMTLRRDLMMLQQNSYRHERYVKWINDSGETTTFRRIFAMIALFLSLVTKLPEILSYPVIAVICAWNFVGLIVSKYKKPLVFTPRAIRLMTTACVICAALAVVAGIMGGITTCICVILAELLFSPFAMLAALAILSPVEKVINRKYYNEAVNILRSMPHLKVIGITGSYGKTSTKHYLYRILSEQFDTLMTPGSFNTTMGVIRTIREHLKPYNEVFIVEMGAKQIGDIREICNLVNPQDGIITAVGEQHLQSFKSIENVQKTKFELSDALPSSGLIVLNNDFEYIANREVSNVSSVRYSISDKAPGGYHAENIQYSRLGTEFTVVTPNGDRASFSTPLVGECNISNLIGAITMAIHLGVPMEKIRYAVAHMEQVEHRLNRKITPAGITIIDDAFNSNPDGSRMALDVLSRMTGGKRIVITPGMIELGEKQQELNRIFGERIADSADIAVIVGKYNRDAIVEGIKSKDFDLDNMVIVDTFAQAQSAIAPLLSYGDTILYENDLPDTFK